MWPEAVYTEQRNSSSSFPVIQVKGHPALLSQGQLDLLCHTEDQELLKALRQTTRYVQNFKVLQSVFLDYRK